MKRILVFTVLTLFVLTSFSYALDAVLPDYNVIEVPYISQLYPTRAITGCEATALLMGLQSKGAATDVSLKDFLEFMPKTASNPAKGFAGSPYSTSDKIRTTIYPKPLSDYANTYMSAITRDISGSDLEDVKKELLNGNPVVIYATMWWNKPFYREFNIEGEKQWLLRNNHAVLLTGYDANTQQFYIADPYNKNAPKKPYFYWIAESKLKPIYDERKWAIAVGASIDLSLSTTPLTLADISLEHFVSTTINGHSYQGILNNDAVYLDAAFVLKKELNYSYSYDSSFRSAFIYLEDKLYTINFINDTVYRQNEPITKLSSSRFTLDNKEYFTKQDIEILLDLLQ